MFVPFLDTESSRTIPPTLILLLLGSSSLKISDGVKKKSKLESNALIIKKEPRPELSIKTKTVINLFFLTAFI